MTPRTVAKPTSGAPPRARPATWPAPGGSCARRQADRSLQRAPTAGGSPVAWSSYGASTGYELVTDGAGTTVWALVVASGALSNGVIVKFATSAPSLGNGTLNATYHSFTTLAVDGRFVYSTPGWNVGVLQWLDKNTLTGGGQLSLFHMAGTAWPGGITSSSCAVFWTGSHGGDPPPMTVVVPSIQMSLLTGGPQFPILPLTLKGRMVSDAQHLYWIDGTSIGKVPMPL